MGVRRTMCVKGLHELPVAPNDHGKRRCFECRTDSGHGSLSAVAGYRGIPNPPDEVLDSAACRLADAPLFDLVDNIGRPGPEARARLGQAQAICANCPVQLACFADALEWKREGVWGGEYMTSSYHTGRGQRRRKRDAPALDALATLDTLDTTA